MSRTTIKETLSAAVPLPSSKTVILPPQLPAPECPPVPGPPCPAGYRLLEKIGSGGMGEVWKARDLNLGRCVAIKYLRAVATVDDLARFRREAETASRLNHPGVTTIHAVGQEQGRSYIVMQLVCGRTLAQWPREDVRGVVRIVRDAARAVAHAHAHGVLHRDLKPPNILLEERESATSEPAVVVTDFGLAKWLVDSSTLTQSGQAVGTPAYMPPEQVVGGETGRQGDVYSLGATLYEMLQGRPPFSGANALQILRRVVDEEPEPVPGELGAVIAKAMEKNPSRRYPTADELAEDLDRWLSRQRVRAPRPGLWHRLRRRLERRPALAAALAAGLLLAVALGIGLSPSTAARRAAAVEAVRGRVSELLLAWVTGRTRREQLAEQVIRELEALLRHDRRQPQAWIWLGRSRRLLGHDAAACWEEALRASPGCREALLERSRHRLVLYGRARGSDFGRPRADTAEEAGLLQAAVADRQAARRDGDRAPIEDFLDGVDALRQGGADAAEAAFSRYLQSVAWDGPAFALRSQARRFQGRYADAEADGSRAVELSPRDPWVAFLRASVFHDQSRLTAAEREYDRGLQLDPAWAPAFAARGGLYADHRMAEKAEADLRRAVDLDPRDVRSLARLGDVLVEEQRWTEAEAVYTKAVHQDPGCALAWRGRARLFRSRGQHEAADEDFTRALAADPFHAQTHEERGNLRRDLARHAGAIQDWLKAVELDPRLQPSLAPRIEASTRALPK